MADFSITGAKLAGKPMVFELDIVESPPSLILLINPINLDVKFTPKVVEERVRWMSRSKSPYVLQAHHDELDVLSMGGTSALFYTNQGLTSQDRQQSVGYENIERLVAIYRNNGMNFNRKPNSRGMSVIDSVGRVVITYDEFIYRGSFDSFSLTETAEKPFNLEFSFDFRVTETYNIQGLSQTIMTSLLESDPRFARS